MSEFIKNYKASEKQMLAKTRQQIKQGIDPNRIAIERFITAMITLEDFIKLIDQEKPELTSHIRAVKVGLEEMLEPVK
jgi:hypothetical protein